MKEMKKVPQIITGKDLDYLSDMFNWNYLAYKRFSDSLNKVTNKEIQDHISTVVDVVYQNMVSVVDIISGGINE